MKGSWVFEIVRYRDGYRSRVTVPKSEAVDLAAAKRRVQEEFQPGRWFIWWSAETPEEGLPKSSPEPLEDPDRTE